MTADRTFLDGSRRASFSAFLRARYRLAASALRMARGTELAGRPRRVVGSPTRFPISWSLRGYGELIINDGSYLINDFR